MAVQSGAQLSQEWEGQQIEDIPFGKLVLWSENPRDPISSDADNADVIANALNGKHAGDAWRLDDLASQMGDVYDLSELPIVVHDEERDRYVVYDGNRRIALALIGRGDIPGVGTQLPLFPKDSIPCNVCTKDRALEHVLRKHGESGSWSPYHRDLFLSKYMGKRKSILVRLQDAIGAIDKYPGINQRYVRDEILTDTHLAEMGLDPGCDDFGVAPGTLENLVRDIVRAIENGDISTRKNRKDPASAISADVIDEVRASRATCEARRREQLDLLQTDDEEPSLTANRADDPQARLPVSRGARSRKRKTARSKPKEYEAFGGILSLESGGVNNLYRALDQLWRLRKAGRITEPEGFAGVFRAGLRLLVEAAARDSSDEKMNVYVERREENARKALRSRPDGADVMTFLSANGVDKGKLVSLLHVGAHVYTSSCNEDQALAMSILVGAMLSESHGKQEGE